MGDIVEENEGLGERENLRYNKEDKKESKDLWKKMAQNGEIFQGCINPQPFIADK